VLQLYLISVKEPADFLLNYPLDIGRSNDLFQNNVRMAVNRALYLKVQFKITYRNMHINYKMHVVQGSKLLTCYEPTKMNVTTLLTVAQQPALSKTVS
jgi:hypothetical protein